MSIRGVYKALKCCVCGFYERQLIGVSVMGKTSSPKVPSSDASVMPLILAAVAWITGADTTVVAKAKLRMLALKYCAAIARPTNTHLYCNCLTYRSMNCSNYRFGAAIWIIFS